MKFLASICILTAITTTHGELLILYYSIMMLLENFFLFSAQVLPTQYAVTESNHFSTNGSNTYGQCSTIIPFPFTCTNPASSVLFDEHVPTLTELRSPNWASEILTLQTASSYSEIEFSFSANPGVERVEVVMFNCPQWGIGAQSITVLETTLTGRRAIMGTASSLQISCESLVTVCLPVISSSQTLTLQFFLQPGSNWVHLAEVTFADNGNICPTDAPGITQLPPLITSAAPPTTRETPPTSPPSPLTTSASSATTSEPLTTTSSTPPSSSPPCQCKACPVCPNITNIGTEPNPNTGMESDSTTPPCNTCPPCPTPISPTYKLEPNQATPSITLARCEVCTPCPSGVILAVAIPTAIASAILISLVFSLLIIACRCQPMKNNKVDIDGRYENNGNARNNPLYMEVGPPTQTKDNIYQ